MTGITFSVEMKDAELVEKLGVLTSRLTDMSGFFANVGEELLNQTKDRFATQTAPDGTPWQELSAGTVIRRTLQGATPIQILRSNRQDSSLYSELHPGHGSDFASVSSTKPYAAIHQFGGTINRPARVGKVFRHTAAQIMAYSINMPARPFLGMSDEDEQEIIRIASDWLDLA